MNPPAAVGVAGMLAAVVVWPSMAFCGVDTVTKFPGPDNTGAPSGSGVSSAVTVTVTLGVVILKD